jgi:hypothetical protein
MTTGRVKDSRSEFLWIEKLRAGVSGTAIGTYYRGGGRQHSATRHREQNDGAVDANEYHNVLLSHWWSSTSVDHVPRLRYLRCYRVFSCVISGISTIRKQ